MSAAMIEIGRDSISGVFCTPQTNIHSFGQSPSELTLTVRLFGERMIFGYSSKTLLSAEYNRLKLLMGVS